MLLPQNYLDEKTKFFQEKEYNPQFIYQEINNKGKYYQKNIINERLAKYIEKWLKKNYHNHIKSKAILRQGPLKRQEIIEEVNKLTQTIGIPQLNVTFLQTKQSWVIFNKKTKTLNFNSIDKLCRERLIPILRHEIETHYLRSINHERNLCKQEISSEYLITEEGLAVLNKHYGGSGQPLFINSIIHYWVAYLSSKYSFYQTFQNVQSVIENSNKAWKLTFRSKQGISNTAEHRGYYKNTIYLQGLLHVWQWAITHKDIIQWLYLGKITTQQAEQYSKKYSKKTKMMKIILPSFLHDPENYIKYLYEVSQQEHFQEMLRIVNV